MIHHHTRLGWFLRRFAAWYTMCRRQGWGVARALRGAGHFAWTSERGLRAARKEF